MQLLRINLLAIKDLLVSWKRLLWLGPVVVLVLLAMFFFYYLFFSVFAEPVIQFIIPALPFSTSIYGWFLFGLIFPIAGSLRALSVIWIRADSVIYTEDRSKWIAPFGQTLMISAQALIYLFGMAIILWLVQYAIVPRLEGNLIWSTIPAESVLALCFIAFFPMWSRIWIFPATGAVEGENTAGIWNALCAQTSGYNFLVLLIALIQMIPGIIILFLISQIDLSAFWAAFENIQTVRPEILGQIIQNCPLELLLILIVAGGFYLSWLGVAQVETIRFFMAAPLTGGGNLEEVNQEEDDSRDRLREALSGDPSQTETNLEEYTAAAEAEKAAVASKEKQAIPLELLSEEKPEEPVEEDSTSNEKPSF